MNGMIWIIIDQCHCFKGSRENVRTKRKRTFLFRENQDCISLQAYRMTHPLSLLLLILMLGERGFCLLGRRHIPTDTNNATPQAVPLEDIGMYFNQIRTSPSLLLPLLTERINNTQTLNKQEWINAYEYISSLSKLPTLNYSIVLEKACIDHLKDIESKGVLTHSGSDGHTLRDRIDKYTNWTEGDVSEAMTLISTDPKKNKALEIILSLIINEGMAAKPYRQALFNPQYRYYGCATELTKKGGIATFLFSDKSFELDLPDIVRRKMNLLSLMASRRSPVQKTSSSKKKGVGVVRMAMVTDNNSSSTSRKPFLVYTYYTDGKVSITKKS